jgi:hypothetical protein
MTQLEKASFVLNAHHDTPSEELGGRLYINVTETLSVAIHDDTIAYLSEEFDEYVIETMHEHKNL